MVFAQQGRAVPVPRLERLSARTCRWSEEYDVLEGGSVPGVFGRTVSRSTEGCAVAFANRVDEEALLEEG
jgi:hypothetical protein